MPFWQKPNKFPLLSSDAIFLISVACLDSFLAVLSGFLGALVLGIFHLSFRCVLAEWDAFKREHVDENSESGRIAVVGEEAIKIKFQ
jgi:hypothetical protein